MLHVCTIKLTVSNPATKNLHDLLSDGNCYSLTKVLYLLPLLTPWTTVTQGFKSQCFSISILIPVRIFRINESHIAKHSYESAEVIISRVTATREAEI